MAKLIALGHNYTDRGHYDTPYMNGVEVRDGYLTGNWVYFIDKKISHIINMYDPEAVSAREFFERLTRRSKICRIWGYFDDGSREVFYWYDRDSWKEEFRLSKED